MALIKTDWTPELSQAEEALDRVIRHSVTPMVDAAVDRASLAMKDVLQDASTQLQGHIQQLTAEVHDHRQLTADELRKLIDYAALRIGEAVDTRLSKAREEATALVNDKIEHVKAELAEAARISRRTLFVNVAISLASTLGIAVIGLGYRRIVHGELDLLAAFRMLLLATAAGSALLSGLRMWSSWRSLNRPQKDMATIAITQVQVLRPNGAWAPFLLALLLAGAWVGVGLLAR